ncbi:hypothetical protein TIFTF001_010841 [Ficus carica]|uniref:Radical SAM core domain-containing protein n=1 Tax=Ficus carica TaxID=3494 RepID=A0AA88ACY2_FICCA|nr:hypothetical protein TIFTF001_010841 [Ficus carica]
MEIGCVWLRRIRFRPTSLASPSPPIPSSPTRPEPTSLIFPTPLRISSSRRRSLSAATASSSSPNPLVPADLDFYFEEGINGTQAPTKSSKVLLKGMTYSELEEWVQSRGFRPGQALMLWKRLYGDDIWAHHSDELEGLNKDFKKMLSENAELKALTLKEIITASDGTRKNLWLVLASGYLLALVENMGIDCETHRRFQILFTLEDGLMIETVVIPCENGRNRNTVCVSSQVGCAMNCQFCYTGRMGLTRHLTAAEIVEQAVFARRLLTTEVGHISNVVFMGMGEPLHNIDNVIKAADIMVHDQGLHFSPRKVTVSTSGLVPQLKRFLQESNCALAVSLNATTDEVRNWIMPINRKYELDLLLQTLREELRLKRNYKVLFEYVMLAGVNDRKISCMILSLDDNIVIKTELIEDARRLVELVQGIPCKINLISFNPHSGSQFRPTSEKKIIEFRNRLAEAGCVVFLRLSRGDDQMAACGQLGKPGALQAPVLRVPEKFRTAMELSARFFGKL